MKCFTASLGTETNTFSPMPTSLASFKEGFYARPGEHPDRPTNCTSPLWAARKRAQTRGWTVVEGSCSFAQPAGTTVRRAYEELRDEILEQLRAALPVDIVLMGLHGAMVADGYDDCEGDLLARIRAIVGPDVPIGCELDHEDAPGARLAAHAGDALPARHVVERRGHPGDHGVGVEQRHLVVVLDADEEEPARIEQERVGLAEGAVGAGRALEAGRPQRRDDRRRLDDARIAGVGSSGVGLGRQRVVAARGGAEQQRDHRRAEAPHRSSSLAVASSSSSSLGNSHTYGCDS